MSSSTASAADTEPSDFALLLAEANAHWQKTAIEGESSTADGVTIRYARLDVEKPRALIVLSNGRSESYVKYKDTAYQLNQNNYSVLLYDHRGQGFSDRLLDDPKKGYVGSFDDYVNDLKSLYESEIKTKHKIPTVLLSHSMGGTVAVLYAQKYPDDFDALVLSSPMLGLNAGNAGQWLSGAIDEIESLLFKWFGIQPGYVPGIGQYSDIPFEKNQLTHSTERYQNIGSVVREHPEIALGDPTTHWVRESYRAFDALFNGSANLRTPFLLLQAGGEKIVSNEAQNRFCQQTIKFCFGGSPLVIESAKHELLNESDEFRNMALAKILMFLDQVISQD